MSFNMMGNKRLQDGGKEGKEKHVAEKGNELCGGDSERGRKTNTEGQAAGAKRKQWEETRDIIISPVVYFSCIF